MEVNDNKNCCLLCRLYTEVRGIRISSSYSYIWIFAICLNGFCCFIWRDIFTISKKKNKAKQVCKKKPDLEKKKSLTTRPIFGQATLKFCLPGTFFCYPGNLLISGRCLRTFSNQASKYEKFLARQWDVLVSDDQTGLSLVPGYGLIWPKTAGSLWNLWTSAQLNLTFPVSKQAWCEKWFVRKQNDAK